MRKKRYGEAIELFQGASSCLDTDWRAMWNLGWCYYSLNQFGKAEKWFDSADRSTSAKAVCKWAKGLIFIEKQKYKKAEQVLVESLQLKEMFQTRIALALAYLAQGKVDEAEKTHLEGIKLGTRLTERYESYAAFLSDVGRESEAERMNQKVRQRRTVQ
jgi:tetratricopeptide (TPR) repeat protein